MDPAIAALLHDLKTVRRGLGVHEPALPNRAGAELRRMCGVLDSDLPGTVRDKISTKLDRLIARLPEATAQIARTALGFAGPAGARYTARLRSLQPAADRETRTMQRRADDVLYLIAELAFTDAAPQYGRKARPWHTKMLTVSLILDRPEVEVFETRRIVSHVDGLDRLEHSLTVPPTEPGSGPLKVADVGIDPIQGCDVGAPRPVSSTRLAFDLRLPRVLNTHDEHEFFLRVRVPVMCPFYFCTPSYPCDRFELRIRFGRVRVPARIWVVDGEFSMEAADPLPARRMVRPDSSGEVAVAFDNLEPARSYGIGWDPAPGWDPG